MAQDARFNTTFADHPKTKKVIRKLGPAGGWHLVRLFLWTAANRTDGDLSGMSDEDIELAVDWNGEEGAFVTVLAEVGFLDGQDVERHVHDWSEHNPWAAGADMRSAKARWNSVKRHHGEAEANRQVPEYAAVRKQPASQGPADGDVQDAGSNASSNPASTPASIASSSATRNADSMLAAMQQHAHSNAPSPIRLLSEPVSYPTPTYKETHAHPADAPTVSKPKRPPVSAEQSTADLDGFVNTFWPGYPRKTGKEKAWAKWKALHPTPEMLQAIMAGLAKWKAHPNWAREKQFVHHPATWLHQRLWEDEEVCGAPASAAPPAGTEWFRIAGFENRYEANNEGCYEHNAQHFRDGHRVVEPA